MSFLDFLKSRMNRYLIPFILLLFLFNILSSFTCTFYHQNKTDEQNIALLDLNFDVNIIFGTNRIEKRSYDKMVGIFNIRNYYDNSVDVIFKIYPESIKNSLSNTSSANTFIITFFSTDT